METEAWCGRDDSAGVGEMKYLCFLVTKATDKQHVKPGNLVLATCNM